MGQRLKPELQIKYPVQLPSLIERYFTGKGANVILDCIGGCNWKQNVSSLATDGRWVLYGTMGGRAVEGELLGKLLSKRGSLLCSLLRSRSLQVRIQNWHTSFIPASSMRTHVKSASTTPVKHECDSCVVFFIHSTKPTWWRLSHKECYRASRTSMPPWGLWLTAHSTWRTLQKLTDTWRPTGTRGRLS